MAEGNNNEEKNKLTGEVKETVKKEIMKKMMPFLIKGAVIGILILAVSVIILGVFSEVGKAVQSVIDEIVDFFTIDETDGAIIINDEQIDAIINAISDLGVNMDGLKLMGDVDYSNPDIQEENKKALRKYIRKFYEAQAVTQTINTNPGWVEEQILNAGKPYGTVYIHRTNGEDEVKATNSNQLTYISYEEMLKKQEQKDKNITRYFSIDEEGKLVIAGWTNVVVKKDGTVVSNETTISLRHINYKNVISQYTTQMNYFLYMAMITQNPEFVSAVTDLVKNSDIRITVLDTESVNVNTEVYTYTENTKIKTKITDANTTNTTEEYEEFTNEETKTENTETIITSTIPTLKVTYAKTWFCEQTITYNKTTENSSNTDILNSNNSDDPRVEDDIEPELEGEGIVTWITEKNLTTTNTSDIESYEEGIRGNVIDRTGEKGSQGIKDSNGNGKVDQNEKVDENSTFLGLLDNNFKIPNTTRYSSAGGNLVSGAEIFFYLLREDAGSQNLEQIMRYILYKYTGRDYGVTDFDFSIFDAKEFSTFGGIKLSPFGTSLSREEFIRAVRAYNGGGAYSTLSNIAGDFYDICTSSEYNVNPCLAFAWACIETGYGSSIPNNNLFGYAVYNGANSGASYGSYTESIKDFCKWMVNASTAGNSAYNAAYARAEEFATVNSIFSGTPDKNIYALFCRYMYLGDTHIADEPDFANPAGIEYYKAHGSTWGAGGRIYTYTMYEAGGLYTNEYAVRCGHPKGTDYTTLQERADYAQYSIDNRVKVAKNIFGNACFFSSGGSLVEAAYAVADHFINSGVDVHYSGNDVEGSTNNGRTCVYGNIQGSWDLPISNPNKYGVVCATFVSFAMWQTGIIDEDTINQYGYNSCSGIETMLTTSSYASQWQKITNKAELEEGDVVFYPGHILIYVGNGKAIDQNYCVISSSGHDGRGNLVNVTSEFTHAYRYVGN